MNVHKNARMTVHGRLLLVARVRDQGWRVDRSTKQWRLIVARVAVIVLTAVRIHETTASEGVLRA